MNIHEIKQTMLNKGIPTNIMEQFVFPKTEDETPEEKIAFASQMDRLLTKEQILSVMQEQGCNKNAPADELMSKLKDKSIEERIELMNAMDMSESARSRLNDDGTLSIFWNFHDEKGKYKCVCSIINELSEPKPVSLTYCGCCSGHVKYHFENFLGVKLRLIETVSSPISSNGTKQCEHLFEIVRTLENGYNQRQELLKKVSGETMRFMRGRYALDEIGNGKNKLTFCNSGRAVLTIYIKDGYYDFEVGQATVRVTDTESLEEAKRLILARMEPNRMPFAKTHMHLSNCGHRCDLCIHYKGNPFFTVEEKEYRRKCHVAVYGSEHWAVNCDGCHFPNCDSEQAICRKEKGIEKCRNCGNYTVCLKTAGWPPEIHTRTITADQVTWAILPYVKGQYGN